MAALHLWKSPLTARDALPPLERTHIPCEAKDAESTDTALASLKPGWVPRQKGHRSFRVAAWQPVRRTPLPDGASGLSFADSVGSITQTFSNNANVNA